MRHLEQIRQHSGGFQRLESILQDVWVLRDDADEIVGVGFGEEGEVSGCDVFSRQLGPTGDRAESRVCVLEVRASVALEGCHGVHVKFVVVDSGSLISKRGP